jgi:transposase-like protein
LIDRHREVIEEALAEGATKADIARALGVPPATLHSALERWSRPERERPGADALAALRRLADDSA